MKNNLITLLILVVSQFTIAQSQNKNYVKSTSYQKPVKSEQEINALSDFDKIENITYYDGLGRPEQHIALRSGGQLDNFNKNLIPNDWKLGATQTPFYLRNGQVSDNGIEKGLAHLGILNYCGVVVMMLLVMEMVVGILLCLA